MSRRRRPHPARRARRVVGATAVGAYAGLMVAVGWAQRTSEATSAPPVEPTPDATAPRAGVERLDLSALATLRDADPAGSETTTSVSVAPTPPPPPSLAATTTTVPRVTVPPPTAPPPTTSAAVAPTSTAAPTTTQAPPATTTTIAPPTTPPPTSIPTSGS